MRPDAAIAAADVVELIDVDPGRCAVAYLSTAS